MVEEFDLNKIDLGKDEAENDERLKEYFLKTDSYDKTLNGTKTIIQGRKGSGKSAIYTLLIDELPQKGIKVIPITPNQYSWGTLKDYKEQGILPEQAHTNAWKITLLAATVWKLSQENLILPDSTLNKYYSYFKDSFVQERDDWFLNIVNKVKKLLSGVKTAWFSVDYKESEDAGMVATPLRICEEIKQLLNKEWPKDAKVRILIDKLDDSWDATQESKNLIIGLLKAGHEINSYFKEKLRVTIFIRSDIYSSLFFDDQDKLRQYEETIIWGNSELKEIIAQRVKVSLGISWDTNKIWTRLFSSKAYRSRASAEKYIIDRTFKRPRDIISFVRTCIQIATKNEHSQIETKDTRLAEEEFYSQSKYKDFIIEYQKQVPYIKELLDFFSGSSHKIKKEDLISNLDKFSRERNIGTNPHNIIRLLFTMGFIGIKRIGRAGVKQRGGAAFYYYYDDPAINPLAYEDYYIHPSVRYYLNIREHRG